MKSNVLKKVGYDLRTKANHQDIMGENSQVLWILLYEHLKFSGPKTQRKLFQFLNNYSVSGPHGVSDEVMKLIPTLTLEKEDAVDVHNLVTRLLDFGVKAKLLTKATRSGFIVYSAVK